MWISSFECMDVAPEKWRSRRVRCRRRKWSCGMDCCRWSDTTCSSGSSWHTTDSRRHTSSSPSRRSSRTRCSWSRSGRRAVDRRISTCHPRAARYKRSLGRQDADRTATASRLYKSDMPTGSHTHSWSSDFTSLDLSMSVTFLPLQHYICRKTHAGKISAPRDPFWTLLIVLQTL